MEFSTYLAELICLGERLLDAEDDTSVFVGCRLAEPSKNDEVFASQFRDGFRLTFHVFAKLFSPRNAQGSTLKSGEVPFQHVR